MLGDPVFVWGVIRMMHDDGLDVEHDVFWVEQVPITHLLMDRLGQ